MGYGIRSIVQYIESNLGCFLQDKESVCKVQSLSCCQKNSVEGVPFCDERLGMTNVCNNFNEEVEKTCCRLCNCEYYNCLPNQTLECQRPTIGEALTYFTQNVSDTVLCLKSTFPCYIYMFYIFGGFIFIWILIKLF